MASRLDLQAELEAILGSRNVYFQPPASLKMKYPCIRYSGDVPNVKRADDSAYKVTRRYEGVIIDLDPDSTIPYTILQHFPMCELGKPYTADNLNHFPFTLYI